MLTPLLLSCGGSVSSASSEASLITSSAESSVSQPSLPSSTASSISSSNESALPSSSSEVISSSSPSISSSSVEKTDGVYQFYCVNDFHGSVLEYEEGNRYEAGIAKYFGELKRLKAEDPEHTIILSAGDMFQGSFESNSNWGFLVTDCMNATGFDAMTVGNHEFDYGPTRLLNAVERAEFPVLGANVMRYQDGRATNDPWSEKIIPSAIIERGGNKIGIVGVIGEGQTTSVSSQLVQDIIFPSPAKFAISEAIRLRQEEGCSLVVAVVHDDMSNVRADFSEKEYFDGVFCGHSHKPNNDVIGGVPFVQSYSNSRAISHFEITIKDNASYCSEHNILWSKYYWEEDADIAEIRDSYILQDDFKARATAVAGTVEGRLTQSEGVPNLCAKAIYEKYSIKHPEIQCAIVNSQRASLSGTIDYSDIYKATPFLNHVVIAKVLGSEIKSEVGYSGVCNFHADHETLDSSSYYYVACLDYLMYHQSENKSYNYFPSLNTDFESKIIAEYEDFPFDIAFDYIKNDLNGTVNYSDFRSSNDGFGEW